MKILFVDDELSVKEAMEILIDWKSYGINEILYAPNGKKALEILEKEHPEIMFCDMQMPVMNGPELLKEIAKHKYKVKIIAVSGYDDFPYVRATLLAEGIDYILKPINPDEITAALERAMKQYDLEEKLSEKEKHYQKISTEVSLHNIRQWLDGRLKYDEQIQLSLQSLNIRSKELLVSIIVFQNHPTIKEEFFDGMGELMQFSLQNILQEMFGDSICRLIDMDGFFQILLVDGKKIKAYKGMLDRYMNVLQEMFHLQGIYEFDNHSIKTPRIFEQVELLKYRMLSRELIPETEKIARNNTKIGSIKGIEKLLYAALQERSIDGVNKIVTDFCNTLKTRQHMSFREMQFQTIEANLTINRLAHEILSEEIKEIKPISVWIFDLQIWKEVVKNRIYLLMEYQPKEKLKIESVYRYLQEHYNEDISIDILTEYFYQSPQYISKRFKDKYDMTIVTALRRIRMEHAKQFLETSKIPVIDIAKMTGYEDENYFGKVFKKETGFSPKHYRQQLGKE